MAEAANMYEFGVKESTRWGAWEIVKPPLKSDTNNQIVECQKYITVNPGASMSLQIHHYRGEIYHGLEGVTHVCVNGIVRELKKGDQMRVPQGSLHFSWNQTDEPCKFHEIQRGSLCDENDIWRAADKYKSPSEMNSDEEIITVMIETAERRYNQGERVVWNRAVAHNRDIDLLSVYQDCRNDKDMLRAKMEEILRVCKNLHQECTPTPQQ